MMTYNANKRKFGEGYTYWLLHSAGAGYDASGEALVWNDSGTGKFGNIAIDSLTQDLGAYSEGSELLDEEETIEDEIAQELTPIQKLTLSRKGKFTVKLSLGDINKMAIAAGYSSPGSSNGTGKTASTVLLGVVIPVKLSFLHIVKNVHDPAYRDLYYMPNIQVDPKYLLSFKKKAIRESDVVFNLNASGQDEFLNEYGHHEAFKIYYETSATFDKCLRNDTTQSSDTTWDELHDFGSKDVVMTAENAALNVFSPGSIINKTSAWLQGLLSGAVSGKSVAFAAGISSEDASGGKTEVHNIFTAASTWTLTAKNFVYGDALIVVCLDEHGAEIDPGSVTITPGAVGSGTVVCVFSENKKGKCLIFDEGPNGGVDTTHGAGVSWTIDVTGLTANIPMKIQAYVASGGDRVLIEPGSVVYSANTYTLTMSASISGYSIAIY